MTSRSVKALRGNPIVARNGEIGFIVDVCFDDERWTVRYLVVDTGRTMPRREVLIASASIAGASPGDDSIRVQLTRVQVEKSPEIDARRPVSRQHEMTYAARAATRTSFSTGKPGRSNGRSEKCICA